jgi:hypothetical protein
MGQLLGQVSKYRAEETRQPFMISSLVYLNQNAADPSFYEEAIELGLFKPNHDRRPVPRPRCCDSPSQSQAQHTV